MADAPLALPAPKVSRSRYAEGAFRWIAASAAASLLVVLALMLFKLGQASAPAWSARGGELITGARWAPSRGAFGGLPFVYGTLITSAIAIIIGVPIALSTALFLSEVATARARRIVAPFVDLLAAVPSVVFGLWGVFVLIPTLRPVERFLGRTLGSFIPIFSPTDHPPGAGYLTAGVILAIMIIPTVAAISREVFLKVPRDQREAALALGATRWEMIRTSVLPVSRPGIVGAIILGLGRALGETIAVTMVIGNSATISKSVLAPGYTMPSIMANEFSEASGLHQQALIAIGLTLFGVTLLVNILARALIGKKKAA